MWFYAIDPVAAGAKQWLRNDDTRRSAPLPLLALAHVEMEQLPIASGRLVVKHWLAIGEVILNVFRLIIELQSDRGSQWAIQLQ